MLPVILLALSWGIAIGIHYFKVFGTENLQILGLNPNWEEDELENEIRKLKKKRVLKEELLKEKKLLDEVEETLELKELQKRRLDEEAS
ncbi:MAG: 2TM domain-containing protein [Bacteroidota bacterium]